MRRFDDYDDEGDDDDEYEDGAPLSTWETVMLEVTAGGSEGWAEGGLVERMYR